MKAICLWKIGLTVTKNESTLSNRAKCEKETPCTRVRNMQMAKFESISPIEIGLNVTEYESTLPHGK